MSTGVLRSLPRKKIQMIFIAGRLESVRLCLIYTQSFYLLMESAYLFNSKEQLTIHIVYAYCSSQHLFQCSKMENLFLYCIRTQLKLEQV